MNIIFIGLFKFLRVKKLKKIFCNISLFIYVYLNVLIYVFKDDILYMC